MRRIQLLQIIRSEELIVLIEYGVLRLLHFLGQVLQEGTPFRCTAHTWDEVGAHSLLLLRDEDETRIGAAKLEVVDRCFGLDVCEKLA